MAASHEIQELKTDRIRRGFQPGEKVSVGPNRSHELPEGKGSEGGQEGTKGPVFTSRV